MAKKRAIDPSAPGTTPQNVMTPKIFLDAVRRVYGADCLEIDLAASEPNVCDIFIDEDVDALKISWRDMGIEAPNFFWCNPPFGLSRYFVKKAAEEKQRVLMLVQSAFGSAYWARNISNNRFCKVIALTGRVPFVGYKAGANIDCSLIEWGEHLEYLAPHERLNIWNWRNEKMLPQAFWSDEIQEKVEAIRMSTWPARGELLKELVKELGMAIGTV